MESYNACLIDHFCTLLFPQAPRLCSNSNVRPPQMWFPEQSRYWFRIQALIHDKGDTLPCTNALKIDSHSVTYRGLKKINRRKRELNLEVSPL